MREQREQARPRYVRVLDPGADPNLTRYRVPTGSGIATFTGPNLAGPQPGVPADHPPLDLTASHTLPADYSRRPELMWALGMHRHLRTYPRDRRALAADLRTEAADPTFGGRVPAGFDRAAALTRTANLLLAGFHTRVLDLATCTALTAFGGRCPSGKQNGDERFCAEHA